ncbi:MAG: DUF1566 domain-containing protein [Desulfamplus sp.]|nr:DUF1566 domain-containing protein [Desulfamplus sp.]
MKTKLYSVVIFLMFTAVSVFASSIPDTGITKCYDDTKEIPCPKEGEDFYGQDGNYSINPMSYTKLDSTGKALPVTATTWAMVKDNVTGLIWENNSHQSTWNDAPNVIAQLNTAKFGGYSDWRMPTLLELSTIIDYSVPFPGLTINTSYFKDAYSAFYWSSSASAHNISYAWGVNFGNRSDYSSNKGNYGYLRAVRAGQSVIGSLDNLTINGDGTVSDSATGLMWQQDTGKTVTGGTTMVWKDALSYCENLNLGGYTDWRLPTAKELRSIADYTVYSPVIDTSVFRDTFMSFYWSSSTCADYINCALGVHFNDGEGHGYSLNYTGYVRAVRNITGKTPPTKVVVISPKTDEEIAKCPVVFRDKTFTLNFPAYSSPVDIYIAILNPDGKLLFVNSSKKLTTDYSPYSVNKTSKISTSFSVADSSFASEIYRQCSIYWLVAPSNGGDLIKSINGAYELGGYGFTGEPTIEFLEPAVAEKNLRALDNASTFLEKVFADTSITNSYDVVVEQISKLEGVTSAEYFKNSDGSPDSIQIDFEQGSSASFLFRSLDPSSETNSFAGSTNISMQTRKQNCLTSDKKVLMLNAMGFDWSDIKERFESVGYCVDEFSRKAEEPATLAKFDYISNDYDVVLIGAHGVFDSYYNWIVTETLIDTDKWTNDPAFGRFYVVNKANIIEGGTLKEVLKKPYIGFSNYYMRKVLPSKLNNTKVVYFSSCESLKTNINKDFLWKDLFVDELGVRMVVGWQENLHATNESVSDLFFENALKPDNDAYKSYQYAQNNYDFQPWIAYIVGNFKEDFLAVRHHSYVNDDLFLNPTKTVDHITITGSPEVYENSVKPYQYTCTAYYSDGTKDNVTENTAWIVDNKKYASIDSNGLVTLSVSPEIKYNEVTITASYRGKIASLNVKIMPIVIKNPRITSLNCTPKEGTVSFNVSCSAKIENIENVYKFDWCVDEECYGYLEYAVHTNMLPNFSGIKISEIGSHTIKLCITDGEGNEECKSVDVVGVNSKPTLTSFSINNGASSTSTKTVTLNNSVTGNPTHYMASESSSFSGASWQTYSATPSFTLSSGIGTKTVYFKVKNNDSESSSVSDSISLIQMTSHTNSLSMTFNLIPAGTFTMGSPSDELGRYDDETQHQVTLTKSYYMQTTEVTQAQWKVVMGSNPSYFSSCGDNCPVEQVSWDDVQTFINKLNAKGEGTYSLPTEAQWEYAARAGSTTAFANGGITQTSCGDANLDAIGWYCLNNSVNRTEQVAQKSPNAWGLYDMHGNVWEWCHDWYESYPHTFVADPIGPESGSYRVLRGGGWFLGATLCRSACRGSNFPYYQYYDVGFRLVYSASPTLLSIAISGLSQVDESSGSQYTCTAKYSDGSTSDITSSAIWSENSSYATIDTPLSTNLKKLRASISWYIYLRTYEVGKDEVCTITVTYGGKSDTHTVTIKNKDISPTLSSIRIDGPTSVQVIAGISTGEGYDCVAIYSDNSEEYIWIGATWSAYTWDNLYSRYINMDSQYGSLSIAYSGKQYMLTVTVMYGGKTDTLDVMVW